MVVVLPTPLTPTTIMIIGHTRAVASIEHNIAQFWEMILVQRGVRPPMHGASVGVATLLVWPMFTRFMEEDLSALDLEAVKAAGLPTITPMLICNTDDYPTFNTFTGKDVTNADVVIELAK